MRKLIVPATSVFRAANGETPFSANGETPFSSFFDEDAAVNFEDADFAKISEMLCTDGDKRERFSGEDFGTGVGSSSVVALVKQDNPPPTLCFISLLGLEPPENQS